MKKGESELFGFALFANCPIRAKIWEEKRLFSLKRKGFSAILLTYL